MATIKHTPSPRGDRWFLDGVRLPREAVEALFVELSQSEVKRERDAARWIGDRLYGKGRYTLPKLPPLPRRPPRRPPARPRPRPPRPRPPARAEEAPEAPEAEEAPAPPPRPRRPEWPPDVVELADAMRFDVQEVIEEPVEVGEAAPARVRFYGRDAPALRIRLDFVVEWDVRLMRRVYRAIGEVLRRFGCPPSVQLFILVAIRFGKGWRRDEFSNNLSSELVPFRSFQSLIDKLGSTDYSDTYRGVGGLTIVLYL